MARKRVRNDEPAWGTAKTICRLNTRQVEMARALGMNPKKLPRLRPSPRQRWKLPVGAFIEECYQKRFGERPPDHRRVEPDVPLPHRPTCTASSLGGDQERTIEGEDDIPF